MFDFLKKKISNFTEKIRKAVERKQEIVETAGAEAKPFQQKVYEKRKKEALPFPLMQ